MKKLSLICLLIVSLNVVSQDDINLVGIWQNMPVMASGWSDNYQFFEDGRCIHNYNQMNCADSLISELGFYQFKKNKLILKFHTLNFLKGGQLVPATASCGGDFELIDATETSKVIFKKVKFRIEPVATIDEDFPDRESIMLNNDQYWKMVNNPNEYY